MQWGLVKANPHHRLLRTSFRWPRGPWPRLKTRVVVALNFGPSRYPRLYLDPRLGSVALGFQPSTQLEQGRAVVGLSLRLIPIDSRYAFVELKPGPRFTAGRYFTLEWSVETRAPGCQRTPDTEHVCPISQIEFRTREHPDALVGPGIL